jgi:hypothetical protein
MLVAFVVTFAILGDDPTPSPSLAATDGSTLRASTADSTTWNVHAPRWDLSSGGLMVATEAALPWLYSLGCRRHLARFAAEGG